MSRLRTKRAPFASSTGNALMDPKSFDLTLWVQANARNLSPFDEIFMHLVQWELGEICTLIFWPILLEISRFSVVLRRREICGNWYCWRLVALIFRDGFNLVPKVPKAVVYACIFWNCTCKYYCVAFYVCLYVEEGIDFLEETGVWSTRRLFYDG